MPYLPTVNEVNQAVITTGVFAGYNRNMKIGEGNNDTALEFYDMENLTSKYYPLMANRQKRGTIRTMTNPGGLMAKEKLAYAENGKLYYDGQEIDGITLTPGEKQFVSMGAYLVVFPDRKYVNTANLQDCGSIDAETATTGDITYRLCDRLAEDIDAPTEQPEEPENGDYWLDTTGEDHVLKQYNGATQQWITVPTVYTKISSTGIGAPFKQYDGINISGVRYSADDPQPNEGEEPPVLTESGEYTHTINSIPVTSTWTVTPEAGGRRYKYTNVQTGVESAVFDISSIPKGASITSIVFSYSVAFQTGNATINIYGSGKPAENANILEYLNDMQGDYKDIRFTLRYKAAPGYTGSSSNNHATVTFRNISLTITYGGQPGPTPGHDEKIEKQFDLLNGSHILMVKGDDFIVITGLIDESHTQTEGVVTVTRKAPEMDYITEAYNRLWGCHYGIVDGKTINEIYCCALGDFTNWQKFEGVSTDSYTASVGTDGAWTGAITHMGSPVFFKENYMHKVSVSPQGAHQIQDIACRGVQDGCWRSLAIVGETLFYKSRSGVMAYDGSLPQDVSAALGNEKYHGAVAGVLDERYYLSMSDENDKWHLFVLDTAKGLWHREDNTHVMNFARIGNELYYINADTGELMTEFGSEGEEEEVVVWSGTTGLIGYTSVEHKYISRFCIRMALPQTSFATLLMEYDSDGIWHHSGHIAGHGTTSFVVPVRPRRCDHFRFRIEGKGDVRIYSIAKIYEAGSDVE